MTRWKPKHTKEQVIELFNAAPEMKSTEMARQLNCKSEYVRATLARAGLRLARSKRKTPSLCGINQTLARNGISIKKNKRPKRI